MNVSTRSFAPLSALAFAILSLATLGAADSASDWPAWRGPTRDGHAAAGQSVPVKWSESENVAWRTPIRGRGHSSPIVVGDRVYVTTADTSTHEQIVIALERSTGKPAWETVVHRGNLDTGGHRNASQASSTAAWDGERLYVNFPNDKAIHTTALDASGRIVWQRRVSDFVTHQGFGSSPVVHGEIVLVTADHKGGGTISGLDRRTGQIVWQQPRPKIANYTSPAVVKAGGRTQVVVAGCNLVSSFEPATGAKLWETAGATEECVVTVVTDGQRIFTGGGYPRNHTVAIEADGSGRVAWTNNTRVYVPSMLVREGHLYAVLDSGLAVCWKADTGEEKWKERLGGDVYASPVMVGPRVYSTNLRGVTSVFEATPSKFTLLAQNTLGDEAMASPAICGNRIYLRAAKKGDAREEFIACIAAQR